MERCARMVTSVVLAGAFVALSTTAPAHEPVWQVLHEADDHVWLIKTSTMITLPADTVSFWSKIVPRRGSDLFRQGESIVARSGRDAARFEFIQRLDEVECNSARSRTVTMVYYDKNDRILFSQTSPRSAWTTPASDIQGGRLHDAVCGSGAHARITSPASLVASAAR